jgi:transposase-like protein
MTTTTKKKKKKSRAPRRKFTPEFKADPVKLATSPDVSVSQTRGTLGSTTACCVSGSAWTATVTQADSPPTSGQSSPNSAATTCGYERSERS